MAKMLFASNSVSHFPGSVISGEGWAFDANRVPYAIEVPIQTIATSPLFEETSTDETWVHFRVSNLVMSYAVDERLIEVVDQSGIEICRLSFRNYSTYGWHFTTNMDDQQFSDTRFGYFGNQQIRTIDIQIKHDALNMTYRVYVNEILLFERIFAYNNTNKRNPRYIWLGGNQADNNADRGMRYSEIIVSEGDTRNARLNMIRPFAVGQYSDWDGAVGLLSDDDPTTGMTTISANQSQSSILSEYTGANNISNIVQVTSSVRGANSPTQMQHFLRMSGVDYLTPNFSVPFEKTYQITDWNENPATSLPWDSADLNSMEFGFKSIA